jgi:gluconokinase
MLYDTESKTYRVETTSFSLAEDTTKQDAMSIYEETVAIGRKLAEGKVIDLISLSGAWHSLFLADQKMNPVTPVYAWSNTEASPLCSRLREDGDFVDWYYKRTGCMVSAIYPAFKLMMLKEKGYCLSEHLVMGQGSYNMYRLTGERVTMDSMASGTGLMNIHNKTYDREILDMVGVEEHQLERIVSYQETLPLSEGGAQDLGLTPGIPVMACGSDGGLNQVGSGAICDGVMTFSVGTSGAIRLSSDAPVIPDVPSTWCYLSPKKWLSGGATSGATNCIDWFKNRMFESGTTYTEIEQGFSKDTDPPIFLPFLFGERAPGWEDSRTGGFYDIRPCHSRHDMYRAVMEGVLFNLYQNYQVLTKLNGDPRKVMLSGGILNSAFWTRTCVDMFNVPMTVNRLEHNSLLGGVVLGMEILGLTGEGDRMPFGEETVLYPDREKHMEYQKRYERYLYWYHKTSMAEGVTASGKRRQSQG